MGCAFARRAGVQKMAILPLAPYLIIEVITYFLTPKEGSWPSFLVIYWGLSIVRSGRLSRANILRFALVRLRTLGTKVCGMTQTIADGTGIGFMAGKGGSK